ncbi:MAG: GNAT family N-acetyltransferase [Chloroflexota bacterium]
MKSRPLFADDRPTLQALLEHLRPHNVFHLSALEEFGLVTPAEGGAGPWAIGAFDGGELRGALVVLRGTGGIYHTAGDRDTLEVLAAAVHDAVMRGRLALLSGHTSQLDVLLPLVDESVNGRPDRCHFRTLVPGDLTLPEQGNGFAKPRLATDSDMEKLVDFYQRGFYSLARLPSRAAWRNRLSEQMAFRTLYMIEDSEGKVISAAQSSAEGGGAAMLGGVATLDEYRGQGLSTLCVGALCSHLFAKGMETVSLFYLKDNVSAARVYEKLGFRAAGEWLLVPMGLGILFGNL